LKNAAKMRKKQKQNKEENIQCKCNKNSILLIVTFFAVLLLPIGQIFFGTTTENIENKTLQTKPVWSLATWQEYPQLYEAYYNDTLPYKNIFVKVYNKFIYNVFYHSPANYVIRGKDDWLFYHSKYRADGDELGDYQRTATLSDVELAIITDKMTRLKNLCDEIGAEFYVLIGPNKMEIYGDDYLPAAYVRNNEDASRTEKVVAALQNEDISVIYPKDALLVAKETAQVYYKLDTHWNNYGAYIAYREFMQQYNPSANIAWTDMQLVDKKSGDLAQMIQMPELDDTDYAVEFRDDITMQIIVNEPATAGSAALQRTISDVPNGAKLMMYRDSFTTALLPYMSKTYSDAYYVWSRSVDGQEIRNEQPAVVVFEVVERYVSTLPYEDWNID